MILDDEAYFRRRALQEDLAARNARCEAARERHDEMAAMYLLRCSVIHDRTGHPGGPSRVELEPTV
jgi:hypothetical protein